MQKSPQRPRRALAPTALLLASACAVAMQGQSAGRMVRAEVAGNVASGSAPSAAPSAAAMPVGTTAAPAKTFHDTSYKLSFDYPSNWTFARKDREISTFHLDARTAPRNSTLRAVAAIAENPFPASTFSGAYVYFSVTPHTTDASCASQATVQPAAPAASKVASQASGVEGLSQIGGVAFAHGHDEQRAICVVVRDDIYTTYRRGACYRFDLTINNFCGGEVSGVRYISDKELEDVRRRMESILSTVRFDPK